MEINVNEEKLKNKKILTQLSYLNNEISKTKEKHDIIIDENKNKIYLLENKENELI